MRKALAGAVVLLSLVLSSVMLLAAPASALEQTVTVRDNSFDPTSKTVSLGDTIKWTNSGANTHNVTFDPPLTANLGDMTPGGSVFSPAFTTPGTFTYFCRFHQSSGMRGTVVVGGSTTGAQRITSNATSIPLGGSITVQGTGWPASSQLNIFLTPGNAQLATATSDGSGNFSQLVAIPSNGVPGTYQLNAAVAATPAISAPPLPLTITAAAGTTATTSATASTVTTLATGSLPSSLPPGASPGSSGTNFGAGGATGTPRTGRNEHLMMVVAAVALALGTLLVMVTPKPGRHAKRAFSNLF
jgi:plastocyanin